MTQPYGQQPGNYGQQPWYGQQAGYPQQQGGYPPGPTSPAQGFQQPGGYPQQGGYPQAPSYAPGTGGLPQAPPEYGQGALATVRPGTVTAAAVLGYVQAGITLITTIIGISSLMNANASATGNAALAWLVEIAQLAGIILLIVGGVQITQGKSRTMLVAGAALELAICVFYLIVFLLIPSFGVDVIEGAKAVLVGSALFFAVMPAISLILSLGGGATEFLRAKRGR
jgi:hypothetical protein